MEQSLRAQLDQRPMTTFQWSVVGVCMALNMIDGFDVLVMVSLAGVMVRRARSTAGWLAISSSRREG